MEEKWNKNCNFGINPVKPIRVYWRVPSHCGEMIKVYASIDEVTKNLERMKRGSTNSVKIAIPATGRLAEQSLEWLAGLRLVDREWADKVNGAIKNVKKREDEKYAKQAVISQWEEGLEGVTLKYDLRSGWRASFSAKQVEIDSCNPFERETKTQVTIYGSEYPTISGIREGLAELAVIGFDELLASMLPYLNPKKLAGIKREPYPIYTNLNDAVSPPNSTDVRVIGVLPTDKVAGLFLIGGQQWQKYETSDFTKKLKKGELPVYVKGKYEGLAYYLLGEGSKVIAYENIEDAVNSKSGIIAFDIVETGQTILKNEFRVFGKPPFLITMPVLTVDIAKYKSNATLQNFVRTRLNSSPEDMTYISRIGVWKGKLEKKLDNKWHE